MAAGTPQVHAVQAVRAFSEAAFGADSSASIGSYTYLPIREGTAQMVLTRDELDPMQVVQHIDEGRERILGKRSWTLTFTMNLAPTGTAAVTATSAVTSALGLMLKAVMGGESLAAGSTSAAGSTATVINVQTGHGSRWAAGKVMGWTNASSIVEWREVESVSTDAITLKHGFSGSPSNGNALYNAATYSMTANPSESLAFLVEGLDSDDRWLLTGGQATGGFTIALDVSGQIPSVTFNLSGARWYASNETGSSITGTLSSATYTAYNPIVGEAGEFRVYTVGTATLSTASIVYASAISYEPHISYVPYTAPSGINTVVRWVKARNTDSPVSGSWTSSYQDTTWWAARNALGDYDAQYVMGTAAGSAVILSAPTIQILNPQRVADANGLAAETIMWKGRRDTDVGSSTTDLAKSPFRIHLG